MTPDGHARVEVLPKGDPDDTAVLRHFVTAVLAIAPNATGPAVLLFEAGNTVVRAFVEAGIFALGAILSLLAMTLRRVRDVLLTLVPLLVAGIVTLELSVVLGLKSEFCQHHRLAAAARGRRRLQDLLRAWRGAAARPRWCNRA